jgi:tetratricopeptide (TPR) repeat protein
MNVHPELARRFLLLCVSVSALGCSEFRARQHARQGNRHFHDGNYAAAVDSYAAAEQLHPMPVISFNKGLACRQLMVPGAKSPENERATNCALDSFRRLKQQSPSDPRADQLYQQTLFDADRFEALAQLYTAQLQKNPTDPAALNGLIQVYSSSGRWDDTLRWTIERAKRSPRDAEAHYAVGVLIYSRLFEKGGGVEQATYDPRPQGAQLKVPPATGPGDITGDARVALAEQGIDFLKKAVQIRPAYPEALTYLGLLYRQESFAYFNEPLKWQTAVDTAEELRKQASALHASAAITQP